MGLLTNEQVEEMRPEAEAAGEGVLDTLIAQGEVMAQSVTTAKAAQAGAEVIELGAMRLEDSVIAEVPRNIVKRFNAVPVYVSDDTVTMAVSEPSDLESIDGLQVALGKQVEIRVASESEIEDAIGRYYGQQRDDSVSKMIQDITEGEVEIGTLGALEDDTGAEVDADAPIINLVSQIIIDAYNSRASDIHLEPMANIFRVRYRIDGVLHEIKSPPKALQSSVISRLKIMSNMSISERRIPQDGRINTPVGEGKTIDLRVSCVPTTHGESIVMRILDKTGLRLGLAELGFFSDDQATFEQLIALPDGILLVTGPTGSGKTTTLYSCLHFINRPDRKIITVEDPVEYQLDGINQVQVHEAVGLSFAHALRAMLRQSPNIIMLGEIRDLETATIAINASLTGHLVFSTLHTNDAPSAVTRLVDIGIKPFLVASSTRAMMAQRLVRKLCRNCAAPYEPSEAELRSIGLNPADIKDPNYLKGAGCAKCNSTGYRGRFGIFEVFVLDDDARKLIYDKAPASTLRTKAREIGMRTLREDGARKVIAGQTTTEEVLRVTMTDEE
ncbi:MAG: Type II secretion system protein E [Verrucomicrobia subdivision 3 bacterium]|nr:Type II secretion system protein E [Limisphaerales bacterium]MCS1416555.1 Type II secretion system protein E [Limisphaerales bacterium]